MPTRPLPKLLLTTAIAIAVTSTVRATSLTVVGPSVPNGANGPFDGFSGAPGQIPSDLSINTAGQSDPALSSVTVQNGNGGNGGSGADATLAPQAGSGGKGGTGGSATAISAKVNTSPNTAITIAGNGGTGGNAGNADSAPQLGLAGNGGDGGAASSTVAGAMSIASSLGGNGGNGGKGGSSNVAAQAGTGGLGGNGGAATAGCTPEGTTALSNISVTAGDGATGGTGGDANSNVLAGNGGNGGNGGTATGGLLFPINSGNLTASSAVIGGAGGNGGAGGLATSLSQSGNGGNGGIGGNAQVLSNSIGTSSTNSIIQNDTATAGRGGDSGLPSIAGGVVGTPGIGGNATANLTILSANDNLTVSATGGDGGDTVAGHAANGGTANATVTLKTGNITLDSSSIGGDGGSFTLNSNSVVSGGNGGNATIALTSNYTDTKSTSINLTFTAKGGDGGAAQGVGATSGNGGAASFVTPVGFQVPSADVTLTLNLIGGSAGQALNGATPGNGQIEDVQTENFGGNPVPIITTSGNVTINENLTGGNGANAMLSQALGVITYNASQNNRSLSYSLTCTPGASSGAPNCIADLTLQGQNAINAYASALGGNAMAIATATSIQGSAKAVAHAISTINTNGQSSATANTFNVNSLFANAAVSSTSGILDPTNQTSMALLDDGPISLANGTHQVAASLNFFPITNNVSGPINNSLAAVEFLSSQSQDLVTQHSNFSFSATLNPAQLTPADLVVALSTPTFNINTDDITFILEAGANIQIDKTFKNSADAEQFLNQNLDLGPLSSFGTAPFFIAASIGFFTHAQNQNFDFDLLLSNEDPALLTPEPASLSLLTISTLPLLLKRRRPNKLNTEQP